MFISDAYIVYSLLVANVSTFVAPRVNLAATM